MTDTPLKDEGSRWGSNTGHGHVWARPDGLRARCGGRVLCAECARDFARYPGGDPKLAALQSENASLRRENEKQRFVIAGLVDVQNSRDTAIQHFETTNAELARKLKNALAGLTCGNHVGMSCPDAHMLHDIEITRLNAVIIDLKDQVSKGRAGADYAICVMCQPYRIPARTAYRQCPEHHQAQKLLTPCPSCGTQDETHSVVCERKP